MSAPPSPALLSVVAEVEVESERLDLPVVDTEATPEGEPLRRDDRRRLDLGRQPEDRPITVTETLLAPELG